MREWLSTWAKTFWAHGYWNIRKSLYVLRGRHGRCPCHHPSDSGRAGETSCEAVAGWARPEIFQRRVCPLLQRGNDGLWRCGVGYEAVRPFWGRAIAHWGGLTLAGMTALLALVFFSLKFIGYDVSPAQLLWPPRWAEVRHARVELFIQQARAHYEAGRPRDAIASLLVAYQLEPENYAVAMMLAQFYQAAAPETADLLYARCLKFFPHRRNDTARVWFRSLLSRGRLTDVAELARRQIIEEPNEMAWLNALLFAAQHLHQPELLEQAASEKDIAATTRALLTREAQTHRAAPQERITLLLHGEWPDIPLARLRRAKLLLQSGAPDLALDFLRANRTRLEGRDVVRLALACFAQAGRQEDLSREISQLLSPERHRSDAEVTLFAQHLISFPDATRLPTLVAALHELHALPIAQRAEAGLQVLCAAGSCGDFARFDEISARLIKDGIVHAALAGQARNYYQSPHDAAHRALFTSLLQNHSLELIYVISENGLN